MEVIRKLMKYIYIIILIPIILIFASCESDGKIYNGQFYYAEYEGAITSIEYRHSWLGAIEDTTIYLDNGQKIYFSKEVRLEIGKKYHIRKGLANSLVSAEIINEEENK